MQDHRSVADHHVVFDGASFEVDEVSEYASVTDERGPLWRGVEHGIVLHARARTDSDLSPIASQHGARPDRRLGPDGHGSDHHRVGMHERSAVDGRFERSERVDSHGGTVPADRSADRLVGVLPSEPGTVAAMSRRIDIELTSALPDGSWTWRAAGARKPNGAGRREHAPGRVRSGRRPQGRDRADARRHRGAVGDEAEGEELEQQRARTPAEREAVRGRHRDPRPA